MEEQRIHLHLDRLYTDKKSAYIMLTYLALTYRANLKTLSELFKIDEKELYSKLMEYNYSSDSHRKGLEFLFHGDNFDQQISAQKILAFYLAWQKASNITDDEERKNEKSRLLNIIKATKGYNALMKFKNGGNLTDEDVLDILKYQIRYGMTHSTISDIIGRDSSTYSDKLLKLLSKYPSLKSRYDLLTEYNMHKSTGKVMYAISKNGRRHD